MSATSTQFSSPTMNEPAQQTEGTVARTIEQQTAKLPSDVFLWAALGSIGVSAALQLGGKQKASLFVGHAIVHGYLRMVGL